MKKVYVVMIDKLPYVYKSKGQLLKELDVASLPFEPTIHECEIKVRPYTRKVETKE